MPRTARASRGGVCYHVLNRGNRRQRVFLDEEDYETFLVLMERAHERLPMRVLSFCLMPNHFHMALWPRRDDDLGRWMHWLMTSQVRRHNGRHRTSGHLWQGRFKAFPVQNDDHLVTVQRYIERNPLRAGLVERARDWSWSSLQWWRSAKCPPFLYPTETVTRPDWRRLVAKPQTEKELEALRRSVNRGTPFGNSSWTRRTAKRLDLQPTLRPVGRPRKKGRN